MKFSVPILLVLVCFSIQQSVAQERGIGVRIGEPLGVTYKQYFGKKRAMEFVLGTASNSWSRVYYRKSFTDRDAYNNYVYNSHNVEGTFYFQGRYLFHQAFKIEHVQGEFDWYWGLGIVTKISSITYRYHLAPQPYQYYYTSRTDLDIGPEGIAGLEYKFTNNPFRLFAEISFMTEFADRLGPTQVLIGTGGRFKF